VSKASNEEVMDGDSLGAEADFDAYRGDEEEWTGGVQFVCRGYQDDEGNEGIHLKANGYYLTGVLLPVYCSISSPRQRSIR
jgi:hypothetical protein